MPTMSELADAKFLGWLVVVIGAGAYCVVSMRVEENDMAAAFPEQYPEYAGHTKRLIPFVY
jgi:protein-S-isoprenylcysteine O-methyltransferase Ste14